MTLKLVFTLKIECNIISDVRGVSNENGYGSILFIQSGIYS